MAFYKQSEFAKLTGKSPGYISQYISRGKIIKSGKFIDSNVRENADFMLKWGAKDGDPPVAKPAEEKKKSAAPVITIAAPVRTKQPPDISSEPPAADSGGQYQMDLNKKEADLEYKEAQTRILMLKEAQLRGEQIPTELVKDMISLLSKSIISSYKESADAILIDISHRTKMSSENTAALKGKLITAINTAHDKAISEAIKRVKTIEDELKVTPDE